MTKTLGAVDDIAFVIPFEKFVYKDQGKWQVDTPIGAKAARDLLLSRSVDRLLVDDLFKTSSYLKIMSVENVPGAPPLFEDTTGALRLNTWVAPRLSPSKGEWPRIGAIINWLTGNDTDGAIWFLNWLAFKVQNPAARPLTAVLFCSQPGPGKNTLSRVVREMLGMENTADLERKAIESNFNARWARSLFCFGDDIFESGDIRGINEKMKVLIASEKIEIEGKGTNQREIPNRLAWILSSNQVAPLVVEKEDRRYSIFNNFDLITPEHRTLVKSCWDPTQPDGMDPAFVKEIQGFWDVLESWEVDRAMVSTPYENEARRNIIESNKPAHELFFEDVDLNSIDTHLSELLMVDPVALVDRDQWDFGEEGVSTDALYRAYRRFCENAGRKPLALNKFGGFIQKHRPVWPGPFQRRVPGTNKRVNIYQVHRSPEALEEYKKRAQDRERKELTRRKREMASIPSTRKESA